MAKDAVAQAIQDTLGGSDTYGDNITGAVFSGLKRIAHSVTGDEYRSDPDTPSLCTSIDGVAAALNNLAAAVRETKS
jgi:hypothetical protein